MNGRTVMKKFHWLMKLRRASAISQILFLAAVMMPAAHADEDRSAVKGLMHALVLEYAKLSPYLGSEEAFNSPKGRETVKESLTVLQNRIQKNPPREFKQSPGFRISYGLLADHIEKTKEVFDRGEMEYARMRVNGIGNLCAGCHLQVPKISHFSAFEFVTERSQKANFENANLLFTIRRYDEALKLDDELIRGFPKTAVTSDQLGELYRQKLAIFARVYRKADLAQTSLSEDLKNKNLPVDVQDNVRQWLTALQTWKDEKTDPSKMTTPELIHYVDVNLPSGLNRKIAPSDPQLLNLLRISGLLYERLYAEPNGENVQAVLYYLARCERSLAPNYWYSMNEIYLKECVVRFPKKSYSKKCYDAYEQGMQERYFGKSIPEPVRQSLKALKDYL